jgi:hypothetical protein
MRDIVAEQPILSFIPRNLSVAKRVQSTAQRTDPKRAFIIQTKRTHLIAAQAVCRCVAPPFGLCDVP